MSGNVYIGMVEVHGAGRVSHSGYSLGGNVSGRDDLAQVDLEVAALVPAGDQGAGERWQSGQNSGSREIHFDMQRMKDRKIRSELGRRSWISE